MALQPAKFSDLKNFNGDPFDGAVEAMTKNCQKLIEKPQFLQQGKIAFNTSAYVSICRRFLQDKPKNSEQMRRFIAENFRPYKVLYNLQDQGKFTSYYEAEIQASRTKHGAYVYPIYGRPHDLIEVNLQDFDPALPQRRLVMRIENQKGRPYFTRAQIETQGISAPVILWGNDPVDIFLMQIQGSAVATLDNGQSLRIGYADNNGREFTGIGSVLLKKKQLKPGEASMDKIRDWLKNNPEKAKAYMHENHRYIFHRINDADGPTGAMGVTLTAGRSLAVDPSFIPLGSLLWLETSQPDKRPLQKLMIAQDIGGAIKGAVRGDYFRGHGEAALLWAGKMNSQGIYYILLPKDTEVKVRD